MSSLVILPVRRAVISIVAGPSRATGWLAAPSGLFLTSHAALGYQSDAHIENDAGDRRPARVVAVDVARDFAALIAIDGPPAGAEALTHLTLRENPPARVGDRVFAVSLVPSRGLRVTPGTVCAVASTGGRPAAIDTDILISGPLGGPVVDTEGRAIGLTSLRRTRDAGEHHIVAAPAAELRPWLKGLEQAPDLVSRAPVYRCPTCEAPFSPELDACLACGAPLPHPFASTPSRASAERLIADALASVGLVANRLRIGPRRWLAVTRVGGGQEALRALFSVDEAGHHITVRTPVAKIGAPPAGNTAWEALYRSALTLNDQAVGPYRFSLHGDTVDIGFCGPLPAFRSRDLGALLRELSQLAEHYRRLFADAFGAVPAWQWRAGDEES